MSVKAARTLTLRLTDADVRAVERLKFRTGEKTASKALMLAARMYPELLLEREADKDAARKLAVLKRSYEDALGLKFE